MAGDLVTAGGDLAQDVRMAVGPPAHDEEGQPLLLLGERVEHADGGLVAGADIDDQGDSGDGRVALGDLGGRDRDGGWLRLRGGRQGQQAAEEDEEGDWTAAAPVPKEGHAGSVRLVEAAKVDGAAAMPYGDDISAIYR